jgi:PEP-CTERM motif
MKKTRSNLLTTGLCAAGLLIGFTTVNQLQAQTYDITFTGNGGSAANGQINVVGGIAISGFLDVTAGANQGTYNLVNLTSPLINGSPQNNGAIQTLVFPGGNDQIFDNVVNAGSNPFLTDEGLEFANDNTSAGFNFWGNSPGSYSLYDGGINAADNSIINFVDNNGTATITPVPEPATLALAGLSGLGMLLLRRQR